MTGRFWYNITMPAHPEVLVVGGGVIGLTTAYFLAREGRSVEVVDQADLGREASWAGAGILPPGEPERARTPFDKLLALGSALFPRLSEELHDRTGIDNGYQRCGSWEFLGADDPALVAWRQQEIPFEAVGEVQRSQREPNLSLSLGPAYYLPATAQVRNPRHLKALAAASESLGLRFRIGCPVHGLEQNRGVVTALRTAVGRLSAAQYVLATGAWTNPLLEQIGWRLRIRPVRGQIALLNPGMPLIRSIVIQGKQYLVPRADGRVLAGSTEEDVGFDKRTTASAIADLLAFACRMVPRLASAQVERCWAGLRPMSPDGMPFLGPVPGLENLYVAAGHGRAGIQLSPATAEVMTQLLGKEQPSVPLEPFRLDRGTTTNRESPVAV